MLSIPQRNVDNRYRFDDQRITVLVSSIIASGALRKNYEGVMVDIVRTWASCLDDDIVVEMLTVLNEAGKRVMSGKSSKVDSTATLIMALMKNRKCSLSSADAVRVLEVFGICFKCGGMVMNAIKNTYSTREMRAMLDRIIYEYQQMSRYRRQHGDGTEDEVVYAARLFNVA